MAYAFVNTLHTTVTAVLNIPQTAPSCRCEFLLLKPIHETPQPRFAALSNASSDDQDTWDGLLSTYQRSDSVRNASLIVAQRPLIVSVPMFLEATFTAEKFRAS